MTINKLNPQPMSLTKLFFFILVITLPVPFAADVYVPSLPHITEYFGTTETMVKLTITFYFLGFAGAQLIYGPLSDIYGRRIILLTGLVIGLIGSVLCFSADSIIMLCVARLIQGIGIAACQNIIRAIVVDIVESDQLANVFSYISVMFGILLGIAPLIGSYIQYHFNWQMIFIVLTVYVGLLIMFVWSLLPETNQFKAAHQLKFKAIIGDYKQVLSYRIFLGNAIAAGVTRGGILAFFVLSSFLFQDVLGFSVVQFGWLLGGISVVMIIARLINMYFIRRFSSPVAVTVGTSMMLIASLIMLLLGLLGMLNVWVVVLPIIFYMFAFGLIMGNAVAGAVKDFKHISGAATAMASSIQVGATLIATWIAAHLHARDQIPLAALLTGLSLIGVMTYYWRYGRRFGQSFGGNSG